MAFTDLDEHLEELFGQPHEDAPFSTVVELLGQQRATFDGDENRARARAYDAWVRDEHAAKIALAKTATMRSSNYVRTETRLCARCGEYFVPRWPSQKHCDVISCVCRC